MAHDEEQNDGWENLIAIGIVIALAVGVGWWVYTQATVEPVIDLTRVDVPLSGSPSIGEDAAPVTVVVFSDFECPYCGVFARETFPLVKSEFIDTGKVRFVYKQFPLPTHEHAASAALASTCADAQGKFWEYHDLLYTHQEALANEDLTSYAQAVGIDLAQFGACLNGTDVAVRRDRTLGEQLGVTGTPTFFFNGRKVPGAQSIDDFRAQIAQG